MEHKARDLEIGAHGFVAKQAAVYSGSIAQTYGWGLKGTSFMPPRGFYWSKTTGWQRGTGVANEAHGFFSGETTQAARHPTIFITTSCPSWKPQIFAALGEGLQTYVFSLTQVVKSACASPSCASETDGLFYLRFCRLHLRATPQHMGISLSTWHGIITAPLFDLQPAEWLLRCDPNTKGG